MNLSTSFMSALVSAPKISSSQTPETFLGQVYPICPTEESPLFNLLASGRLHAVSPWSFDIRSIDCFLLLYTRKGCGKLLLNSQVYSLSENTLLLLDCGQRFRIDIAIAPWDYQIAFIDGNSLSYYRQLFPHERFCLSSHTPYSETALRMDRLSTVTPCFSLPKKLMISSLIDGLISDCLADLLQEATPQNQIPSYLENIRALFDDEFQNPYTLDGLEKRFGISKYRLCREFSLCYQISPLQYLNRRRIEVAKHLLCTTESRIHEVGSMVGFDNTNHFINLFKRFTGMTPLEYRQRMTV